MAIHYSREPEPLGTVGAITLLEDQLDDSFLMLNGDLITDLDLHKFTASHGSSGREITVATTKRKVDVDLGVIDSETGLLTDFREKPSFDFQVSMGIYCMNPTIFDIVPKGLPFGFDDLMYAMLKADRPVNVYDHQGLWMDVGREEDFRAAQLKFEEFADTLLAT
jgi:mannose-1-phosphate guanylyltransferase